MQAQQSKAQDKSSKGASEQDNDQVHDELTRQAKWMNKKLQLIKNTAENYKEIR